MQAKIWNHSEFRTLNNEKDNELKEKYTVLLKNSGFNVLSICEYTFYPQGYTCLFLLAESHFAIHTFPEEKTYYIELSSCNIEYFIKFIKAI